MAREVGKQLIVAIVFVAILLAVVVLSIDSPPSVVSSKGGSRQAAANCQLATLSSLKTTVQSRALSSADRLTALTALYDQAAVQPELVVTACQEILTSLRGDSSQHWIFPAVWKSLGAVPGSAAGEALIGEYRKTEVPSERNFILQQFDKRHAGASAQAFLETVAGNPSDPIARYYATESLRRMGDPIPAVPFPTAAATGEAQVSPAENRSQRE